MVVVCPLPAVREFVGELGAEAELVDFVGHGVAFIFGEVLFEEVLEVVGVDVAGGEAAAGGDVEVADDFVDADDAFEAAAFAALGVEALRVAFAVALFDVLAFAEGPGFLGVGFTDFIAGVAAAGFYDAVGGWRAAAFAAVVGSQVFGDFFLRVSGLFLEGDLRKWDGGGRTDPMPGRPGHDLLRPADSSALCSRHAQLRPAVRQKRPSHQA